MNQVNLTDFALGLGALTNDDLIDGKVHLLQPEKGYRVSMDTVMLAAAVPAKPGQRVLEAGTGSAGAALCVAHRCQEVDVVGIELQPSMAALARKNITLNKLDDRMQVVEGCVTTRPEELGLEQFDHVFANPPYLEHGSALRPPTDSKGIAHMDSTAKLKDWVKFCLAMVKKKGTLTFVFRADRLHDLLYLLQGKAGEVVLCPLWPRVGTPAKRVLVQAKKQLNGVLALSAGIALHGEVDRYTPEAEEILRKGKAIDMERARCGEGGLIV
jgi:tRNA1(Val) A37 N6-methylase TrmN6